MSKSKKQISLQTEDLCLLTTEQMLDTQGGISLSPLTPSSGECIATVIGAVGEIVSAVISKEKREVADSTSKVIVAGSCELDAAYCYSYA